MLGAIKLFIALHTSQHSVSFGKAEFQIILVDKSLIY